MKLVVLGSGTANPHARRSSAGFWLETSGGRVMLDFGASALHRVAQEGLDWADLDTVWISHFHLDHCCGLPAFLFATKHAPETRGRKRPLRIFGPTGILLLIKKFDGVNEYNLFKQPFPIEVVEVEPLEKFEILPGIEAMAMKTPHTDESLGLRVKDAGQTLVYTSDTGFAKEIATFSQGVDLLILESSFLREKKTPIHLELAEAMYLIAEAKPKRAMLAHLYADWDDANFAEETGRFGPPCQIIEAKDGLRLDLSI
jgi:ribonuclease BN (tRNA processing enzyme)